MGGFPLIPVRLQNPIFPALRSANPPLPLQLGTDRFFSCPTIVPAAPFNNPFPLRLFENRTPVVSGERIINPETDSLNDIRAQAQRETDRYLTVQRDELLQNLTPCVIYNLHSDFERLPEIYRDSMTPYRDDTGISYRLEFVSEGGQLIPQVRFFRQTEDTSAPGLRILTASDSDARGGDLPIAGAVGAVAATRTLTWNEPIARTGGLGPESPTPPGAFDAIPRFGIQVGGAVLMYAAVDWNVQYLPQPLRGPVGMLESGLLYQNLANTSDLLVQRGILQTGFISQPNWGQIVQSAPHLFVVQYGAAYFWDATGLFPLGTQGNRLASFGTGAGAFIAAPYIGRAFPTLASGFNSSIGVGMTSGANLFSSGFWANPAGGAGASGAAFQAVGAVGAVALGNWVGGSIVDIWAWASGADEDPDYRVLRAAWDGINHDVGGWFLDALGPLARGIQSIASFASDDFDQALYGGIKDRIDGWCADANNFAAGVNEDLIVLALLSLNGDPNGQMTLDRTAFSLRVNSHYATYSDSVRSGYGAIDFIGPSSFGFGMDAAKKLARSVYSDGYVNYERMPAYLQNIFQGAELRDLRTRVLYREDIRVPLTQLIRRVLDGLDRDFLRRREELGLNGRDLRTTQLTPAQRQFLFGDGQTSELIERRTQMDFLRGLLAKVGNERATPGSTTIASSIQY